MAKMRSPNYPAIGLGEAIRALGAVWAKEKRTPISIDVLGKAMGYSSVSGPVRTKIAALRKYGLLDQNGGNYRLSDLAMQALHGNPAEREEALRIAARRPESFRELLETHADASDEALSSLLILKRDFSDAWAKQFIKAFRDTMTVAKIATGAYATPHGEDKAGEGAMQESAENSGFAMATAGNSILNAASHRATFTFPIAKGITADVTFKGGEISSNHIQTLAKYLELMKAAIDNHGES